MQLELFLPRPTDLSLCGLYYRLPLMAVPLANQNPHFLRLVLLAFPASFSEVEYFELPLLVEMDGYASLKALKADSTIAADYALKGLTSGSTSGFNQDEERKDKAQKRTNRQSNSSEARSRFCKTFTSALGCLRDVLHRLLSP
ncbi:Zinc finger MYM-type protein [Corchorus olitorius]|uniref:Zinc finger MYM-type protein n=1 Tax=Corchorus olitorius TaxID=93759 RepID=A0A1R3L130_9ROSI|nr:Zinc finger MYM-type protein [Corchorus olitorius]